MIRQNKIGITYWERILTTIPIVIVLLIVGWFSFNTMWLKDTMMYQFFCNADDSEYPIIHISSLSMIWESQVNHYFTTNGRFFCHTLVQIFSGLLPHWLFGIVNVLVWGLLLNAVARLSNIRLDFRGLSVSSTLVCCGLIFLPFDPAYSINYVWMGTLNLYFILLFFKKEGGTSGNIALFVLCGLYSFLSGQGNESYSLPVSIAIVFSLASSGFRFSPRQWVMAICYGIGAVTVGLAPAVFVRLGRAATELSIIHGLERAAGYFILPMMLLIMSFSKKRRKAIYSGKMSQFILICLLINLGFTAVLKFCYASRMMLFADICSIVLICRGFRNAHPSFVFVALCYLALGCVTAIAAKHQLSMNRKYEHEISEYHRSATGRIYLPDEEYFYDQSSAWTFRVAVVINEQYKDPRKPEIRIYPESLRDLNFPKDSNVVMKIGEQSWVLLQSHSNPRDFIIRKRVRLLGKEMPPRKVEFSKTCDIFVDSTATHTITAYRNDRSYLETNVVIMEH